MKKLIGLGLAVLLLAGCGGHHTDTRISLDQVPPVVQNAVHRDFPGATIKFIDMQKKETGKEYEVHLTLPEGKEKNPRYNADGKWLNK